MKEHWYFLFLCLKLLRAIFSSSWRQILKGGDEEGASSIPILSFFLFRVSGQAFRQRNTAQSTGGWRKRAQVIISGFWHRGGAGHMTWELSFAAVHLREHAVRILELTAVHCVHRVPRRRSTRCGMQDSGTFLSWTFAMNTPAEGQPITKNCPEVWSFAWNPVTCTLNLGFAKKAGFAPLVHENWQWQI